MTFKSSKKIVSSSPSKPGSSSTRNSTLDRSTPALVRAIASTTGLSKKLAWAAVESPSAEPTTENKGSATPKAVIENSAPASKPPVVAQAKFSSMLVAPLRSTGRYKMRVTSSSSSLVSGSLEGAAVPSPPRNACPISSKSSTKSMSSRSSSSMLAVDLMVGLIVVCATSGVTIDKVATTAAAKRWPAAKRWAASKLRPAAKRWVVDNKALPFY